MAVKTRWDKKTYRRHVFNQGRGVHSPHETTNTKMGTAAFVDSQLQNGGWLEATWRSAGAGKLSAEKEYEQYNNPASMGWSPFTSDSTEREAFRKQDRAEVRKLFADTLKGHHFAKHKKVTQGQLDKIVDAYMSQDDDKFKASLEKMGVQGRDVDRWRRAAEESAETAIEGTKASSKWDDDDYTGGQTSGGQTSGGQTSGGQTPSLKNGGQQKKEETKAPSLTPRSRAQVSAQARGARPSNSSTGVIINGAPVNVGDTATVNQVEEAQKNAAQNDAIIAAEARRDTQTWASSNPRRREQQRLNDQMALDESLDRYKAAREARIAANYQRRADARYAAGKLSNEDDWRNLGGRADSNRRDYTKKAEGETDEQFNAVVAKRNEGLKALQDRMTKMADTKSVDNKGNYTNAFYANDPKRQKDLAALRKLVDKGIADGTITDKQVDAVTKKLDTWEQGAQAAGERRANAERSRQAERVRQLREEYNMTDPSYSDSMVETLHKMTQTRERRKILQDMEVAPGQGDEAGRADRLTRFSDNWEKLMKTGFDPRAAFAKAMEHPVNQAAFLEGMQSIARDDPDRADKVDQLRRRFIMNQVMADEGLGDKRIKPGDKVAGERPSQRLKNFAADMARDLPGSQDAAAMTAAGVIDPVRDGAREVPSISGALRARAPAVPDKTQLGFDRQDAEERTLAGAGSQPADGQPGAQADAGAAPGAEDWEALAGAGPQAQPQAQPTQKPGKGAVLGAVAQDVLPKRKEPEDMQQAAKGGNALRPRRRR